jgi:hypothetical protein
MNGDEVVNQCLREHPTNADAWDSIRQYGADESLQKALREFGAYEGLRKVLREFDAEETQRNARQVLRRLAVDEAMGRACHRKAALDSIAESPVWKNPQFVNKLSHDFMAADFKKSRETTKHYIDSAKQPATGPKSKMGNPVRQADGSFKWVATTQSDAIAEFDPASAHLHKAQQGSLQNCGQCANYNQDKTCQIVTGPVSADLTCDKFTGIPAKPVSLMSGAASRNSVQRKNVTADGKLNPSISIMGNPKRNPDGSITWA